MDLNEGRNKPFKPRLEVFLRVWKVLFWIHDVEDLGSINTRVDYRQRVGPEEIQMGIQEMKRDETCNTVIFQQWKVFPRKMLDILEKSTYSTRLNNLFKNKFGHHLLTCVYETLKEIKTNRKLPCLGRE